MGGQQFASGTTLVDMTGLAAVIDVDAERGLVTVGAGIDWVRLINHLLWAFPDPEDAWGIIQKQTGADRLTIGGALSANIHGRGLRLQPFVADVESFTVVDAQGVLHHCSRTVNPAPVRARRGRLRHVRRRRDRHPATGAAAQGRTPGVDRGYRRPAGALRAAGARRLRVRRLPVRHGPRVARVPEGRRVLLLPAGGGRRADPRRAALARAARMAAPAAPRAHVQVTGVRRVRALLHGDRRPAVLERHAPALATIRTAITRISIASSGRRSRAAR